jgi:hypothetical protein
MIGTRGRNFQTSAEYPIIGLWYSHEATSNFADFSLPGMAADIGNMEPRGPLKEGIGRDQHPYIDIDDWIDLLAPPLNWKEQIEALDFIPGVGYLLTLFGGNLVGDDLALAEHALQIRIDDVPLDEIEIRNVYAANVNYIGIHPSEYFAICTAEARAVLDAQAAIVKLQERLEEPRINYVKPGRGFGDEPNPWRQIMDSIINIELPNARSDLRAAEFIYGRCKERNMVSIPADDFVTGGVFTPLPNNGKIPTGNITGGSFT